MVEKVSFSEHKRRASDPHTIPHTSPTTLLPSYASKEEAFMNTLQILFHSLLSGDQPGAWTL